VLLRGVRVQFISRFQGARVSTELVRAVLLGNRFDSFDESGQAVGAPAALGRIFCSIISISVDRFSNRLPRLSR